MPNNDKKQTQSPNDKAKPSDKNINEHKYIDFSRDDTPTKNKDVSDTHKPPTKPPGQGKDNG